MDKKLRFREDGAFKLMQFTDIHYIDGCDRDQRSLALMRELIRAERPDFIMVTGDTVYGERNYETIRQAMAPITESGIPFSWTFGNHDVEDYGTRERMFEIVQSLPGCMAWHDPDSGDGMGNGYVELVNRAGDAEWLLFGMDSGDYMKLPGVKGYGYVTRRQIDWYTGVIQRQEKAGKPFAAMLYMHMPLPEHDEVWFKGHCFGTRREEVCCPPVNSGFYTAMLEAGHTRGVFVGHDHGNDYWGRHYGIALGYGRATGFNTYGTKDHLRGCRIFNFHEGNLDDWDTYVRLEHGVVVDDPWMQHPLSFAEKG